MSEKAQVGDPDRKRAKAPGDQVKKINFCSSKRTPNLLPVSCGIISNWSTLAGIIFASFRCVVQLQNCSGLNYAFSYLDLLFDYQITIFKFFFISDTVRCCDMEPGTWHNFDFRFFAAFKARLQPRLKKSSACENLRD